MQRDLVILLRTRELTRPHSAAAGMRARCDPIGLSKTVARCRLARASRLPSLIFLETSAAGLRTSLK
jgi:hypothetical protein